MAETEKARQRPAEPLDRWTVPYIPRLIFGLLGIFFAMVEIIASADFWFFGAGLLIWCATLDTGEEVGP